MSLNTLFLSESPHLTGRWSTANGSDLPPVKTETRRGLVHVGTFSVKPSSLAEAHQDFDSLALELESDASNSADLAKAGAWVAERFYPGEQNTVRTARLRKGLSQKQLAAVAGTSQPHISTIEKGSVNVMFDTVLRLCSALDITPNDFQAMIQNQKDINTQKESE